MPLKIKIKIATALFLDVTRTFNNISKDRLLYNLCMKKIDPRIVTWIDSFLIDSSTILKTNEYTLEKIYIFYGNTLKVTTILNIVFFYNSPLLKKLNLEPNTAVAGFFNNIVIIS